MTQKASVDENGKMIMTDHQRASFLKKLLYFSGKSINLVVEENLTPPTLEQRGYYYGVLLPIWRQLLIQQSTDNMLLGIKQLHKLSIKMFLPPIEVLINNETGEVIELDPSTKKGQCSKEMYSVMIEKMIAFLAEEYGEVVPEPNKQVKLEFKNFSSGKKVEI